MPTTEASATPRGLGLLEPSFLRVLVWVAGAQPAIQLGWDALNDGLGANGVNYALRTTGKLGLLFLVFTLLVTPARRFTGIAALIAVRRSLGLYAFFYLALHFAIFFAFDRMASISSTLHEIWMRRYLQVGATALFLLVPLAATSTDGMQMRLGAKRWKRLHRLTYLITVLGCVHFTMQVKSDLRQPIAFLAVVSILLGYRAITATFGAGERAKHRPLEISVPATLPRRSWSGELRIVRTFQETPDVRTLRLAAVDGAPLPFVFSAGQYLNVALPIAGKTVRRSYSISSSPTQTAYCEITVKRTPDGYASHYVHDVLAQGHLVSVSGPGGRFVFDRASSDVVTLIGGGVGITPLMSMIRALTDLSWNGRIEALISMASERDAIFAIELQNLARRFPNLHVLTTLTREPGGEGGTWKGRRGHIDRALLAAVLGESPRGPIYLCGPMPFMVALKEALFALGVDEDRVHTEPFVSPRAGNHDQSAADETTDHQARFSRSGRLVPIPGASSLLEAGEDAGLELPYECRSGICGQCKVRLLEGRVTMQVEDALSPSDKASGLILACQAHAQTDLVVDA